MQFSWPRIRDGVRDAVKTRWADFRRDPWGTSTSFLKRHRYVVYGTAAAIVVAFVTFGYFYQRYAKLIEDKLGGGTIRTSSSVYAAPRLLTVGEKISPAELVSRLHKAGYTESADNKTGFYRNTAEGLEIHTGPASYYRPHTAVIEFKENKVARIISREDNRPTTHYWLEPELLTSFMDSERAKRRPLPYTELPKHLVHAIVSVEDKRFFEHNGLDILRVLKAAYIDLREGRKEQGASTVTMQLARSFWLEQEKAWGRKAAEVLLTIELERRFTKQQIMELYANEVYLGRRGSFSIHGFGEAARSYFGKDVRNLTIPEAATLAGIIQRPSYFNPFRSPERVKQRRNLVLTMMHNNGYIDASTLAAAQAEPVQITPAETESSEAPYFVDLVNEDLQEKFEDWDFATNSYKVYSTLDLDLQQDAVEAVRVGMSEVDKQLRGRKNPGNAPQVALIALDPHTGAIKALVGGRSYEKTQLNRVLAKRQPGSAFKPFVYAAALNAGLDNKNAPALTMAETFVDEPTTFLFNKQEYQPANYHGEYHGNVTIRQALLKSLNIPTIKAAEKVGYEKVAILARKAGIQSPIYGTPSLALGAYEMPPIEVAEAYSIFANEGKHVARYWVSAIRDRSNQTVFTHSTQSNDVLDKRIAYIMVNLMEDVLRFGTGAGVRARGFALPAAGKTGTARDGWFAGFTSELLCIVWVGYDDYRELPLEGAKSALPVWTAFMKRAHARKQYSDAKPFKEPPGIVRVEIDPQTGLLVGDECEAQTELFIAGTEPKDRCEGPHFDYDYQVEGEGLPTTRTRTRTNVFGRILDVFR
jgi:penicillin-binding protein 1B